MANIMQPHGPHYTKISENIENTCSTMPILTLTNRTILQGGYLLRKTQRIWKRHIATYHLIRKVVAPLGSASFLIHPFQWKKPHGSLYSCTRKGHNAPTQHGPHPCKVSPQSLVSPIQARNLSSKSPYSPVSK